MDSESKQATRVLAALAESSGKSMSLVHRFQSMPEVEKVSFDFDCYKNQSYWEFGRGSPYIFNWYVDVALKNGNAIWWALDIQWVEEKWIIESCVELPGDYNPEILKEFPDRFAETVDEFIFQLNDATSQLLDSANLIETQM
ncbi:MAG: hypothetical protein ABI891_13090 [Acidobacteriota bacterium]